MEGKYKMITFFLCVYGSMVLALGEPFDDKCLCRLKYLRLILFSYHSICPAVFSKLFTKPIIFLKLMYATVLKPVLYCFFCVICIYSANLVWERKAEEVYFFVVI